MVNKDSVFMAVYQRLEREKVLSLDGILRKLFRIEVCGVNRVFRLGGA